MRIKNLAPILGLVLLAALLLQLPAALGDRSASYEWFDPIILVRRYLIDSYVEEPDEDAMQQEMIQAMIDTLDDPYTVYIPPASEDEFNKELRGTYVGVGAEVSIQNGLLTIVTPLEDSPALAAGVMAGDIVLEIEGVSTDQRPIDECIDLLVGEAGTVVEIRVRHLDGVDETLRIIRQQIITPTIKGVRRVGDAWDHWIDDDRRIGYVRLTQFNNSSVEELQEALTMLESGGVAGLIFDLRDNPGGDLSVAIEIADIFLAEGMIVSVKGRNRRPQSWYAEGQDTLPSVPMIVLINNLSASASEIVAGALQENGRAKVLGTRSFGKGSVQEVHELPQDRGALKLTSGHYYLASGRNLARKGDSAVWGVDPDPGFVVPMTDAEYRDMIRARREFEVIKPRRQASEQTFADPEWVRTTAKDPQLGAALEAVQARVQGHDWPRVGGDEATLLALDQQIEHQLRVREQLTKHLDAANQRLRELAGLEAEAGRPPFFPDDADPTDGTLTVRGRDGGIIASYRIEGDDLEIALQRAPLTPLDTPEP